MAADYKKKYLDIRSKLIESVDVAFRDGYEQGMKEGAEQAQQQAEQEQMMMEQQQMQQEAAMNGQAPEAMDGVPPEAPMGEEEMMPEEMGGEEAGSELDQHISELEGMVSKGEKPKIADLRKAVAGMVDLRKNQKNVFAKKTEKIISGQKNLVDNILNKWEKEATSVTENLEEVIKEHGIKLD